MYSNNVPLQVYQSRMAYPMRPSSTHQSHNGSDSTASCDHSDL